MHVLEPTSFVHTEAFSSVQLCSFWMKCPSSALHVTELIQSSERVSTIGIAPGAGLVASRFRTNNKDRNVDRHESTRGAYQQWEQQELAHAAFSTPMVSEASLLALASNENASTITTLPQKTIVRLPLHPEPPISSSIGGSTAVQMSSVTSAAPNPLSSL
ncbi:hypothetical protein NE237_007625 [Protea cynaroides]|uniref:Uncharacterized protein n=1 Tax=Protea cynaroides TaxID=273540 RepID=A0A9Q0KQL8_9MAGN|nr:hypothetical protein NE237_007625 [Protea cynaroides]